MDFPKNKHNYIIIRKRRCILPNGESGDKEMTLTHVLNWKSPRRVFLYSALATEFTGYY